MGTMLAQIPRMLGTTTLAGLMAFGAWHLAGGGPDPGPARVPVLLELFTSEGCSSCPPADTLLARLAGDQPIPGVTVVALGFHVDYWDGLGWKDAFSSRAFTDRQQAYARAWNSDRVYTPQAVVNGRTEFIGSSWPAAQRLLAEAAREPLVPLLVTARATPAQDRVRVTVVPDAPPGASVAGDLLLAIAEDGLTTTVRRGENANRRLAHVAVVRQLLRLGSLERPRGAASGFTHEVRLEPAWARGALHLVAFVQHAETRRIQALGVATL